MKPLIVVICLLLAGCISAAYKNGDKSVTYTGWFQSANDVMINWGEVSIAIGNISSQVTAEDIAAYLKVKGALAAPVK